MNRKSSTADVNTSSVGLADTVAEVGTANTVEASSDVRGDKVASEAGRSVGDAAPVDRTWPHPDPHNQPVAELKTVDDAEYEIGAELARGGMGRILHARDRRHGRPVAIKELLGDGPTLRARFLREALITARLQHPAIVPVYEAGRWPSGEPFYAMKKVEGRPLDKVIAEKVTLKQRLTLLPNVIAVADALAYAHGQRIIHRDLKPANILVGDFGETVVIDWGLAKELMAAEPDPRPSRHPDGNVRLPDAPAIDQATLTVAPDELPDEPQRSSDEGLTMAGHAMGTPSYMPPEQARGEPADERADVYALGAILYHLLTGRVPYDTSGSVHSVIEQLLDGPPELVRDLEPSTPPDLTAIVNKAIARDPGERYPTAKELVDDLRRFETGQLVGAREYSPTMIVARWLKRHRAIASVVGIATVTLAVVGVVSVRQIVAERDRAALQRDRAERSQARAEASERRALEERDRAERATREARAKTTQLIRAWFRTRKPEIVACYEAQLASEPDLEGTLVVAFDIGEDDRVRNLSLEGFDEEMLRCVRAQVENFGFPGAGPVQGIRYPFHFTRTKPGGSIDGVRRVPNATFGETPAR